MVVSRILATFVTAKSDHFLGQVVNVQRLLKRTETVIYGTQNRGDIQNLSNCYILISWVRIVFLSFHCYFKYIILNWNARLGLVWPLERLEMATTVNIQYSAKAQFKF
jgi:hypothetical protein